MSRVIYWASLTLAFVFLVAPLLIVLPLAFNDSSFLTYPMDGFTFRWFGVFFTAPPWLDSLYNSFKVALGTTLIAVLVGGLAAMGTMLAGKWGQRLLSALFVSPIVIPSVVMGVAMAYAYFQGDMPRHISQLILGPVAFAGGIAAVICRWSWRIRSWRHPWCSCR